MNIIKKRKKRKHNKNGLNPNKISPKREASTRGGALSLGPEAESTLRASIILCRLCEKSCDLRRLVSKGLSLGLSGAEREAPSCRSAGLQPEACSGCSCSFRGSKAEASSASLSEVKRHSAANNE